MPFPQTPVSTEQVFATLFAKGCTIAGHVGAPSPTPLNIMSRRFKQWSQTTASQWPAFYQQETVQTASGYERGPGVRKLRSWWWLYIPPSVSDTDIVSVRMNNYTDALLLALATQPRAQRQTLNLPGVVNVYPDGPILMDEGLLEPPALVRIPISIIIGN